MTKQERTEAALKKIKRNEQVLQYYHIGHTIKQIMELAGVGESTIFSILRKNGIELKQNRHFTEATILHAIELYKDNANTIKHILTTTGIRSEQTLYRYLTERGVERRKNDLQ